MFSRPLAIQNFIRRSECEHYATGSPQWSRRPQSRQSSPRQTDSNCSTSGLRRAGASVRTPFPHLRHNPADDRFLDRTVKEKYDLLHFPQRRRALPPAYLWMKISSSPSKKPQSSLRINFVRSSILHITFSGLSPFLSGLNISSGMLSASMSE